MNCTQAQQWIDDLLITVLDETPPAAVSAHLRECAGCREEHRLAQHTLAAIRPSVPAPGSDLLRERVLRAARELDDTALRSRPAARQRGRFWKPVLALAAAALICLSATVLYLNGWMGNDSARVPAFSLLSKAWAAEEAAFAANGILHLVNEIHVKAVEDPNLAQARWFPIMALDAEGKPRFHQLALGAEPGEEYVVDDQVWFEPASGKFLRLLSSDGAPLFANAYDGQAVYSLEPGADPAPKAVGNPVSAAFQRPKNPAEFLGMGAGLPSHFNGLDPSLVSDAGTDELADGTPVRVIQSQMKPVEGAPPQSDTHFFFKVREDDNTVAEIEWILNGTSALTIRRVGAETLETAEVPWDLGKLENVLKVSVAAPKAKKHGLLSLFTDMVISNVSVKDMIAKADFETYCFSAAPAWTGKEEITDILDVASPPHRMFSIAYRAENHRHVVLVQSYSYNAMAGQMARAATLAYTSPRGVKVWAGPQGKWLADILLKSSRAVLREGPAADCTGYLLETPSHTFPALAVNGPIGEAEWHALVDSLIPAKELETRQSSNP